MFVGWTYGVHNESSSLSKRARKEYNWAVSRKPVKRSPKLLRVSERQTLGLWSFGSPKWVGHP